MPLTLNARDPAAIEAAALRLAAGGLVGMPTETVYGLAADAGHAAFSKPRAGRATTR